MTGLTSPAHIALLLLVALLLFGAKRLPEIGRGLGSGMREFKDSIAGEGDTSQAALPSTGAPARPPVATSTAVSRTPESDV